jgi:hypothetical protein
MKATEQIAKFEKERDRLLKSMKGLDAKAVTQD